MTRPLAELRANAQRQVAFFGRENDPDDWLYHVQVESGVFLALLDCAEALDGMLSMPMSDGRAQDRRVQRAVDACLALERAGWSVTP